MGLLLLHQRQRAGHRSSSTCPRTTHANETRSPATAANFQPDGDDAAKTRLTSATFHQLIESRDAQLGALTGVRFAEGFVVRRAAAQILAVQEFRMKIGVVCYASVGGSGVVATELAHALATRGHEVHLVSSELPFRLAGRACQGLKHLNGSRRRLIRCFANRSICSR